MTVSYSSKVANCKSFGCFFQLLLRWKGSIYKLVWVDLIVFLSIFFTLSIIYHFLLDEWSQHVFEKIAIYCEKYGTLIPLSFVLGFYVALVIRRWWEQYQAIPWVDTLAIWVKTSIRGEDENERLLRRAIMRYTSLAITQCFTLISPRVKKRFPTLDHLVEAGLLLENEVELIQAINSTAEKGAKYPTHFIPLVWAAEIIARARAENKIKNDAVLKSTMDEINKIRDKCALLINYDWISVPLVYTQVVTLAVYVYFFSCLMGRQWVKGRFPTTSTQSQADQDIEILAWFFPVFTILQFIFYMGWLKVAESLLNPFGDDDDDFELNWIVDRNIQVGYLIVDEMRHYQPELLKDQYWETVVPQELPHTAASEKYKGEGRVTSTADVVVSPEEGQIISRSKLNLGSSLIVSMGTPGSKRSFEKKDNRQSGSKFKKVGSLLRWAASKESKRNRRPSVSECSSRDQNDGSLLNISAEPKDITGDESEGRIMEPLAVTTTTPSHSLNAVKVEIPICSKRDENI